MKAIPGPGARHLVPLAALVGGLLLAACSGSAASVTTDAPATPVPATAAASPVPASTPDPSLLAPSGERIAGYVSRLAVDIGSRPAGSEAERRAVDFIAAELRSFGYDVSTQPVPLTNAGNRAGKLVLSGNGQALDAPPLDGSPGGDVTGTLVAAGKGLPGEIPPAVKGNIALIERGDIQFQVKAQNAADAGAAAVVIFNNQPGPYQGGLATPARIPVVSLTQSDGQALMDMLQAGPVQARLTVEQGGTSTNVIARPPGKECETVTAGHLDSVPAGPGANDNGSGTATVIEVAGVMARSGKMGANCFILFGAEEVGLYGSRAYVASLSAAQKARIRFMIDLDMVGVGDQGWYLIGDPSLQDLALQYTAGLGMTDAVRASLASTGGTSDNETFARAGIPALFIYRANDPEWHRPGDTADRVRPDLMEQAARLTVDLLTAPAGGTSSAPPTPTP
jgi:aminopeptidase YwaD